MLADLNWIAQGNRFPPVDEEGRLKRYKKESAMFDGELEKVYGNDFARRALELRMKDANVTTMINYPQLLTKKTADFVCGEAPNIGLGDRTDEINLQLNRLNFNNVLYELMIDVSRYGNGILKLMGDRVAIVPPKHWFPVVDPMDQKSVQYHVLAYVVGMEIHVEIHGKGTYEQRVYAAEKGAEHEGGIRFGRLISSEVISTNLDDFAVQRFTNVTRSDSLYGISDYQIIDGALRELIWRIYCAQRILDKHSSPSIVGPSSMLEKDPITGMYLFKNGNFFERPNDSTPMPQYLTWDGNLGAVQWEIEWLTNQIYTLTEMGAAFLDGAGKGEVNSGRALELRMVSPILKARRLARVNTQTLARVIRIIGEANGMPINVEDVSIVWHDGLPNDKYQDAELYERATAGKPFMSQLEAIKSFNNYDTKTAEATLAEIEGEAAAAYFPQEGINEPNTGSYR